MAANAETDLVCDLVRIWYGSAPDEARAVPELADIPVGKADGGGWGRRQGVHMEPSRFNTPRRTSPAHSLRKNTQGLSLARSLARLLVRSFFRSLAHTPADDQQAAAVSHTVSQNFHNITIKA